MTSKQKSVLEQIYSCEFLPGEQFRPLDSDCFPTLSQIDRECRLLSSRLDDETKPHLERFHQLMLHAGCMSDYANFAYGFRHGMLPMHELMNPEAR